VESTHLCLVSNQPVPNLTPVFDPDYAPDHVVLLSSQTVVKYAEWLQQALKKRQISSEICLLENPYDCHHVRQRVEMLLGRSDLGKVTLNVSTGTRIMVLAAYEVFRQRQLPVFYIQQQEDLLIPLLPPGESRQLPDHLRLDEFFGVHGYAITSLRRETVAHGRQQLGDRLVENVQLFSQALGPLNYLAGTAENRSDLRSDRVSRRLRNAHGFKRLVDLLVAEGVMTLSDDHFVFASEEDRFFANGGWLEEYLFSRIDRLRNRIRIQDAAMSVQVESASATKNEIDIAILHNNRLFLIECKTRRFRGNRGAGSKALYRMDSLKILGGLTAKAMLVSYRRLSSSNYRRAKDLYIDLLVGDNLLSVEERLEEWLRNNRDH